MDLESAAFWIVSTLTSKQASEPIRGRSLFRSHAAILHGCRDRLQLSLQDFIKQLIHRIIVEHSTSNVHKISTFETKKQIQYRKKKEIRWCILTTIYHGCVFFLSDFWHSRIMKLDLYKLRNHGEAGWSSTNYYTNSSKFIANISGYGHPIVISLWRSVDDLWVVVGHSNLSSCSLDPPLWWILSSCSVFHSDQSFKSSLLCVSFKIQKFENCFHSLNSKIVVTTELLPRPKLHVTKKLSFVIVIFIL